MKGEGKPHVHLAVIGADSEILSLPDSQCEGPSASVLQGTSHETKEVEVESVLQSHRLLLQVESESRCVVSLSCSHLRIKNPGPGDVGGGELVCEPARLSHRPRARAMSWPNIYPI